MNDNLPSETTPGKKIIFKDITLSIAAGLGLFFVSLFINYWAGTYASLRASNVVSDIILDNIPVFDVGGIFVYGFAAFLILLGWLMVRKPERAPFMLKSLSIFILIRSFFIILTHIGPIPQTAAESFNAIVSKFTFTGDLFFSAHTGLPFLMALVFWKNKILRNVFIALSIFFGIVVLLGHLHYSIDVFAAFFITFGIFHIAVRLFKKDYDLLIGRDVV
ncbi:MAG: phosphatase PAP2-related protein [Candidatus Magasanikbacteria bacterium]|nr:phosphatase PAP2-related protein [Candidatus Magasanikbacteria bacterium]